MKGHGPTFPHRNYDLTRAQAHRLQQEGEDDIHARLRAPQMSPHSTHRSGQLWEHDRADQADMMGGEHEGWGLFADDP